MHPINNPSQSTVGSRGRGSNSLPARRGGVTKPRGGHRIDQDGDLNMDGAPGGRGRGRGRGRGTRGNRGNGTGADLQTAIARGIANGSARIDTRPDLSDRVTNPSARRGRDPDPVDEVSVRGLRQSKAATNRDGGLRDLLSFLERKASGQDANTRNAVHIIKSRERGDTVYVTVRSQDTPKLLRLHTFSFAGAQLEVREHRVSPRSSPNRDANRDGPLDPASKEHRDRLKEALGSMLTRRYNPNIRLLDLSALSSDSALVGLVDDLDKSSATAKVFVSFMLICDEFFKNREEKREAIVSVSLANNDLKNVSLVQNLAVSFPDLRNLDLSNNKLESTGALRAWRLSFRFLDVLILSGNPIERADPNYKKTLSSWYMTLRMLNNRQIRSDEEALANFAGRLNEAIGRFPGSIKAGAWNDIDGVAENFLKKFFVGYDTDRNALIDTFYDSKSTFSYNVNTDAPRGEHVEPLHPRSWEAYIKGSRNMMKITHLPSRQSRMHTGTRSVHKIMAQLPATRHPNIVSENDKWLLECHSLPVLPDATGQHSRGVDGLIVIVHGEFDEDNKLAGGIVKRSFSRTFVIGPGGPAGVRVVSDLLSLRAYGGNKAFKPDEQASPTKGVLPPVLPPQQPQQMPPALPPLQSISPPIVQQPQPMPPTPQLQQQQLPQSQHELMVTELSRQTRLTPQYATMCLEQNGWDFTKAAAAFQNARANVPPEAFM